MHYSRSTDLLGLLIARIEGASLGEVLERRIFGPLGMKDTAFAVPPEKRHRRSASFGFDDAGRLIQLTSWGGPMGQVFLPERPLEMAYESGGQGLWSTLDDYLNSPAYGGWWQADPQQQSVMIFLAHNMVGLAQMGKGIGLGVWAAIEQFSALQP